MGKRSRSSFNSGPDSADLDCPIVNIKNWYRKEADLWAEFGNKFHSAGKNLLRGFG
jgi:hypothetical protein